MIPQPLHPAVVHFPIVLAVLLPIVGAVALVAIHRGARPVRAWLPVVVLALALAGSAWAAVLTGKSEEERVEDVVAHSAVEAHEEAAEVFLPATAIVLLVSAAGLLQGRPGQALRYLATTGAVVLLLMGVRVGHSGGELVYVHGAASAYSSASAPGSATRVVGDDDDDDRRRD